MTGVFSSVLIGFGVARVRQPAPSTFDDIFSDTFGYDDEFAAEFFAARLISTCSSDFDRFADDPYSFVPSAPGDEDLHVSSRTVLGDR